MTKKGDDRHRKEILQGDEDGEIIFLCDRVDWHFVLLRRFAFPMTSQGPS